MKLIQNIQQYLDQSTGIQANSNKLLTESSTFTSPSKINKRKSSLNQTGFSILDTASPYLTLEKIQTKGDYQSRLTSANQMSNQRFRQN